MLTILQIIAILQGIFLGFALFQRRQAYKQPILGLFIGCIVSVILFSIGDDDYNIVIADSKWFFFHEPLMITFFFLFIRYSNAEKDTFKPYDFLFFLPYLLYLGFETLSNSNYFEDNAVLGIVDDFVELSFLGMLLYSIYDIVKHQKNKWLLAFILPFTAIYAVDTLSSLVSNSDESILLLDSYGIFLMAVFLFYFVTYQLIIAPKDILPTLDHKYKSSKLSKTKVEAIKKELNRLMTEEKLFKNQKLTVHEVAQQIGISRQQLSEVLNIHLELRFQDLLNQYRVEEFIKCLHQEDYAHYTIFGIATEVGFSSKSSFNATFKKLKGLTPSQYKKQNRA
ncbi:MAG: AraC family transcriptional regulator [Bacteroidota bacterium]